MRGALYAIAQCTWGFPQTLAGGLVFLAHARRPHRLFHGAIVTPWKSRKALSLGLFIFIGGPSGRIEAVGESVCGDGKAASEELAGDSLLAHIERPLLVHEYGHTIQSLILGPLYLVAVGIPSFIWLNVPACARFRRSRRISYYAFPTERTANWLAERVLGEPAPRD